MLTKQSVAHTGLDARLTPQSVSLAPQACSPFWIQWQHSHPPAKQLLRLWLPRGHRQARHSWCWPHSRPRPLEAPPATFSPAPSLEGASNLASFPSLFHFLLLLPAGGQLPELPSFRVGSGAESSPLLCRRLGALDRKGHIPAGLTAAGAPTELLHLGACVQRLGPLQRDVPGEPEALLGFPEVLTGLLWWVWPPLPGTPRSLGSGTCQRPRTLRPATPEPSAARHALGGWKRLP